MEDDIADLGLKVAELAAAIERDAAGGVDAIVLGGPGQERIYSLSPAGDAYRLIVERMAEGAAAVSAGGLVLFVNRRFATLLGRSPTQIVGSPATELVVAADRPTIDALVSVQPGELARADVTLAGPGAVQASLSAACVVVDGVAIRCLIATDLTPQKHAASLLEARIEQRTAELVAANQELESFTHSVAHDLRAPLRAINGFCRVIEEEYASRLDEEGVALLQRVQAAAQKLGLLIDHLLELSRIGRSAIRWTEVDLSALAADAVADLAAADPDRVVGVEIEAGITTEGDPELLRSVVVNLIANAWKFTRTTEHAAIEFARAPEHGPRCFVVRDNGVGFDMALADRLLEPFQRLHSASEFEGTGIGLATVDRVVRRHGGRVWFDATPGAGATFWFSVGEPVTEIPASDPGRPAVLAGKEPS